MYSMLLQLTQMVNFWEIPVFLHLSWVGLLGTKWTILHLEIMIWRKYSFETLSQLSQGNNAACAAASCIDGFLWRSTGIFSTQLNRPIWSKQSLSPRWKTKVAGSILVKNDFNSQRETMCFIILILAQMLFFLDIRVFLHLSWIGEFGIKEPFSTLKIWMCRKYSFQKRTKFSQGEKCAKYCRFYHRWFCLERYMCCLTHMKSPTWNKMILSPPWKLWRVGIFPSKN
jgi:hypothetical protein